jgi:membrane protein implicated in regulation of membrane protease activity
MVTEGQERREADAELIDEALAVVRDARRRAPRDFLITLAVLLGGGALVLLAAAALTGGALHELLINLGFELIGALITVVLIDGLWRRLEAGTSAGLDAMSARLEERRGSPMTEEERQAWRIFVDEYQALVSADSLVDRLRALPTYRKRMRALEARGNRTLEEFGQAATDPDWPQP